MARKKRGELLISAEERNELQTLSLSRTEAPHKVSRSRIIIDYSSGVTIAQIVRKYGTNRPLVERTVDKALAYGALAALDDLPRSGRPGDITDDAKAWVLSIAYEQPSSFGYDSETWTYSALAKHNKKGRKRCGLFLYRNSILSINSLFTSIHGPSTMAQYPVFYLGT